ncbi:hypothetical protein D3867_29115 (plasmid) [Azospirillum argentinense]|uniref:TonB-dependent receptor plug domain-containing protein n=1 Tax=Azospirillum brasilense TaxID=192 RepID=A0A4D8Q701_AZOBR|nr:hypothetical protein D3867_29115 [Azospirillum argentinense]
MAADRPATPRFSPRSPSRASSRHRWLCRDAQRRRHQGGHAARRDSADDLRRDPRGDAPARRSGFRGAVAYSPASSWSIIRAAPAPRTSRCAASATSACSASIATACGRFQQLRHQFEPYGLERVDIVKGPSSVLFGQTAPGGVVNLTSKRPTAAPLHEIQLQTAATSAVRRLRPRRAGRWRGQGALPPDRARPPVRHPGGPRAGRPPLHRAGGDLQADRQDQADPARQLPVSEDERVGAEHPAQRARPDRHRPLFRRSGRVRLAGEEHVDRLRGRA